MKKLIVCVALIGMLLCGCSSEDPLLGSSAMNDNGKTIEKFCGPIMLEREQKELKGMGVEEVPNE